MPKISAAGLEALDKLIAETLSAGKLPGFALAVSNLDEQLYAKGAGNKTYGDPTSAQVTDESVFWICSMTKLLAAIAALQLIERGELTFDTPVSKIFPEFATPIIVKEDKTYEPAKETITILHLLTHTSGINYGFGVGALHILPEAYRHVYDAVNPHEQFFALLKGEYPEIPLVFEPGASFAYGFSSDVLGFVVEKVTGQTLEAYSRKNIFDPLGVKATYHLTAELKEKLVDLTFRNADGSIANWENRAAVIQRHPDPVYANFGGIGSYSTLPDYVTILRHLMQIEAGRDVSTPILKKETVKSLFEPKLNDAGSQAINFMAFFLVQNSAHYRNLNWSTGLAVSTNDWEGRRKTGSAFWSGWAGSWYFMDPKTGISLAFASQIVPTIDQVTFEIADKAEEIIYANLE
ncbi:beta-lactamase [Coprinopsis marcescibilis]|uniref:Beta-lactamase n=1 Tax=Coprinopsis marcescibilis TaxID=230819 RepID=A0A5C3KG91_COPMA|nr:beta-lactamase [Coprinopsis marcescibilis]